MGPIPSHRQPADRQAQPASAADPAADVRSLVGEGETIETIIESRDEPVVREEAGQRTALEPTDDRPAVALLTDRRILVDPARAGADGDETVSIPYEGISGVSIDDPQSPTTFAISVESGTTWQIGVAPSATSPAKYGVRLVEKAIDLFEQIDDARSAVSSARSDLCDPIGRDDWTATRDRYDALRSTVGRVYVGVEHSPFDGVPGFCEPLDRVNVTLEAAYVQASFVKIEKVHAAGCEWLDQGDIDRWARAVETARESIDAISDRLEAHDFDVTADQPRGPAVDLSSLDSPMAEATSVEAALESARGWIDALAHRPIEEAYAHRRRAEAAADAEEIVTELEAALESYRPLLEVVWREEDTYGIESEPLQERVEETAEALIETRRGIATEAHERGDSALERGEKFAAGDAYRTAVIHYERALSLARVYRAGDPGPISAQLDAVMARRTEIPVRPTLREQSSDEASKAADP